MKNSLRLSHTFWCTLVPILGKDYAYWLAMTLLLMLVFSLVLLLRLRILTPKNRSISEMVSIVKLCVSLNHLVISDGLRPALSANYFLPKPFAFMASSMIQAIRILRSVLAFCSGVISDSKLSKSAIFIWFKSLRYRLNLQR